MQAGSSEGAEDAEAARLEGETFTPASGDLNLGLDQQQEVLEDEFEASNDKEEGEARAENGRVGDGKAEDVVYYERAETEENQRATTTEEGREESSMLRVQVTSDRDVDRELVVAPGAGGDNESAAADVGNEETLTSSSADTFDNPSPLQYEVKDDPRAAREHGGHLEAREVADSDVPLESLFMSNFQRSDEDGEGEACSFLPEISNSPSIDSTLDCAPSPIDPDRWDLARAASQQKPNLEPKRRREVLVTFAAADQHRPCSLQLSSEHRLRVEERDFTSVQGRAARAEEQLAEVKRKKR
eukprot:745708-Hanusia_phi.AAC.3